MTNNRLYGQTLIIEEDTTISLANTEFEKLSGYLKDEIEGKKTWADFVVKDDIERMKGYHCLRRINPDSAPKNYEFRFIDRAGNIKDIFLTTAMIPGTKKSVASLLDITDRKKTVEQIKHLLDVVTKAKKEWEMTFDNVTELVMIVDGNLEIVRCNNSFAKFAGMSIREIAGRKCYEFFSCNHKQIGLCKVYMQTEEILPRTETKTKEGRWFYVSHCPVTDEKGKFHFSVVVATDITDIKNTQQKLMEYQEELKKRVKELEEFYNMAVTRELKMIELKEEIESLKEKLGKYKKPG
jgi:PAS domain S-box-containing protein